MMIGASGVTVIEIRVAGFTVKVATPLMRPWVAVIAVTPVPIPVAKPWVPGEFEMVATIGNADDQVTLVVMSAVEASE